MTAGIGAGFGLGLGLGPGCSVRDAPRYPSPDAKATTMTETVTIPAHIENGALRLDGPLSKNVGGVEVRVQANPAQGRPEAITKLLAFIKSLPPGTRTPEEIDEEIDRDRDSWDR